MSINVRHGAVVALAVAVGTSVAWADSPSTYLELATKKGMLPRLRWGMPLADFRREALSDGWFGCDHVAEVQKKHVPEEWRDPNRTSGCPCVPVDGTGGKCGVEVVRRLGDHEFSHERVVVVLVFDKKKQLASVLMLGDLRISTYFGLRSPDPDGATAYQDGEWVVVNPPPRKAKKPATKRKKTVTMCAGDAPCK